MQIEHIPLENTGQYPRLVIDYLKDAGDMSDFTHYRPDRQGLRDAAESRSFDSSQRELLLEVLKEQHGEHCTDQQQTMLDMLSDPGSRTISTGHQLCLFGGPVYMLYKVASVIRLAETMREEEGVHVVPLFWMASEDHDIDEIDHCLLFGRRFAIPTEHNGPAGTMPLEHIDDVVVELGQVLGESPLAQEAKKLIASCYTQDRSMAQAFRALIQSLFGKYGLLILDASDRRLKASFSEHMRNEMEQSMIEKAMESRAEVIRNRGEQVQATARDINLFYMTDTERVRLTKESGTIGPVDGIVWKDGDYSKLITDHPERFSPNVLFRPVYQEYILPNIAYVGGPGELSYWLQLKEVMEAFDLRLPVLILRDTMIWIDDRTEQKWKELGFATMDLFRDDDLLYKEFAKQNAGEELDISTDRETMIKHFDKLVDRSKDIDPNILGFAKAERSRLIKSIENLEKKMIRAEKKKHGDSLNRISTIKNKFLPGGSLRERTENFLHWYLKQGDGFIDHLLEVSDPLDARLKVIKV
ncbi:MAG: bacillithiol biosynthesis cysteine-adding enzyme BshC [Flavobacteriales bacterium]|nr:bacillithiol biosynthesis cysteine-adding enzyme BshC [Flavobacteriales bacterium]